MALVEPLVGHLLSKYADTVTEGLQKISARALSDGAFATAFLLHPQGFSALQEVVQRRDLSSLALQTLTQLVESCDNVGVRSSAMREICRGKSFWVLRRGLSSLSDAMLPITMAALQFLAVVANYIPKLVLSQFDNSVPIHLSCFRLQLPYSQRRVRMARVQFLINLVASSQANTVENVVCTHGYLTHLLEDAAELLQEGSETGVNLARGALQTFGEHFMAGRISPSRKRSVLLAQKNVIRLLVKALDYPLVSEHAASILSRMTVDLVESPCDYQAMRLDAEERGMPNYLLFFILRHLRPKRSQSAARLVIFILHQAPDLIRPYFTRVSGHLSDTGNTTRISAFTEAVATLNVMTRAMLAPIPYHLAAGKARLETLEAKAVTFFNMNSDHVAEEVCPAWVAEYVHRLIIGSSDLLMLSFAIQLTHAILTRAKSIQRLVAKLQNTQTDVEMADNNGQSWETFNAKVQAALLKAIPRREEFWHRMTQQIHPMMLPSSNHKGKGEQWPTEKISFVAQRIFLLMESYGEVFHLRMSWLSAVPSFLPTFTACVRPIEDALRRGEGVVTTWPAPSVSLLCSLLVSALSQGVSMTKLHHVTMSSTKKGVLEWPLLLSVMLWAVKHRETRDEETQMALAWVARLIQWTVHSVTVRFVCEFEEAFLWLELMDESTLPCFVHLINYLLQRSMSKSADRIAQELMEGDTGVIVCASRTFIARGEERFLLKEEDVVGVDDRDEFGNMKLLARSNKTNIKLNKEKKEQHQEKKRRNYNNNKKEGDLGRADDNLSCGNDLWTMDLKEHLTLFKTVTDRVARKWSKRFQHMKEVLPSVFVNARNNHSGKRRIALTILQTEKEHRVLRPLHDQVLEFCTTLRAPMPAADTEEEMMLLSVVRSGVLDEILQCLGGDNNDMYRPSVWCRYPTVGWELAGLLLRSLNEVGGEAHNEFKENWVSFCRIVTCSQNLLKSVAKDVSAVTQVLLDRNISEGNTVGFFLFLLAATRLLLCGMNRHGAMRSTTNIRIEEETVTALTGLVLRTYSGTLSTIDRIRYATLLTISYIQQQQEKEVAQLENNLTGSEAVPAVEEEENSSNSEEIKETEKLRNHTAMQVYSGFLVPDCIMSQRFLIMNHQSAPHIAPEVDMLSLLVDTWTDEEVTMAALQCSARLHNTIVLGTKGDSGWEFLRSLFPEFSTQDDIALSSFDVLTTSSVMDPRYLLPLLHTVLAMPVEQLPRKNIGTKCIPILLRSLSFTDPQLRRMGAAALSVVWTPSGPTRIVVGFARLKLTQLAAKKGRQVQQQLAGEKLEDEGELTWNCPRLPAPISAFLVMVLRPLANAEYPLHNDIMRFLLETQEALANPVPLHRFLTSFPLACITTSLMIKRQEAVRGKTKSQIAAASASEVVQELQSKAPLHLDFIIRLIQFGCQTNGDMMAIIRSESLQAIMMLISMVAASAEIRLQLLHCVHSICTTSSAVARQAMEDGHVLSWLIGFVNQLIREYGDSVYMYGEPLFMEVILLLRKLAPLSFTSPPHAQQIQQQLELVLDTLVAKQVTTKDVLDGVEGILHEMQKRVGQSTGMLRIRKRRASYNNGRPAVRMKR